MESDFQKNVELKRLYGEISKENYSQIKKSCMDVAPIPPLSANESADDIAESLLEYILHNMHWCPFHDDCGIDFEKECVGFGCDGCKECIKRNIRLLN